MYLYIPTSNDLFTLKFKNGDRSYQTDIFMATSNDGNLLVAKMLTRHKMFRNETFAFKITECTFYTVGNCVLHDLGISDNNSCRRCQCNCHCNCQCNYLY